MRRVEFWLLAIPAILALLVWHSLEKPSPARAAVGVCVENFQRLHEGMTEAEVERVFGQSGAVSEASLRHIKKTWQGSGCVVHVNFRSITHGAYRGAWMPTSGPWGFAAPDEKAAIRLRPMPRNAGFGHETPVRRSPSRRATRRRRTRPRRG